MTLPELLPLFAHHPGVRALLHCLREGQTPVLLEGLRGSAPALMLGAAAHECPSPYLFVLNDEEEAGYFYHDLRQLLGDECVLFFPSSYRRAVKYGQRDAAQEILRTDVLSRLSRWESTPTEEHPMSLCVVTFPTALAERVASRKELTDHSLTLHTGEEYDIIALTRRLEEVGFRRRDYVYEPGEYALRGSILDVFSFSSELPFRIDFFGDEVETIRTFEVQSQLSKQLCVEAHIVPHVEEQSSAAELVPFTDFLPPATRLVVRNFGFLTAAVQKVYDEGFARQAVAEMEASSEMEAAELETRFSAAAQLVSGSRLERELAPLQRFELTASPSAMADEAVRVVFHTQAQPLFHKNFNLVVDTLRRNLRAGIHTYVLADSEKQNERLREIINDLQHADMETSQEAAQTAPLFTSVHLTLHEGFVDEQAQVALFTDHQIFDRFHKYNLRSDHARNAKIALTLKELMQFEPGDYVVHVDHGVGRFAGLVRMPGADGELQEVIKITYQNNDAIFVSIHALHKVSKYKGREGEPPRLSHLGTGAWERIKSKTKEKLKDIARDLIVLYSRRREEKGFAYTPDTFLQQELEASFAYEDTPDQLKVTQQVKADMERDRPMDRLVCGDVGFGKTEIAVRAAFKAACDNKQVAVMVPTTVLALQHYKTFAKRLKDFPVRVDYLSRARTTAQTKEILKDLAAGNIHIIIGTHKLIGKSVKFKDLGLLIIDEEQKFGVSVKESSAN